MEPLSYLCRWAKPPIEISTWVFQHVGIVYAKIQAVITHLLHHSMIFSGQAPMSLLAISVRKDSSGLPGRQPIMLGELDIYFWVLCPLERPQAQWSLFVWCCAGLGEGHSGIVAPLTLLL